jgi:hypothetical protein
MAPTASTQEKFRDYAKDGYRYSTLNSLLPKFKKNLECIHGEKFDCKDPVKMLWVLSRKVKIYNTEWVPDVDRVVYYRPTANQTCDCKHIWTGEDCLLLNVNKGQCGKIVHLVSYNLLLNYTYSFAKQGSTLRGFLASLNNRFVDQYGAEETELLPFHIFREAVYLFWTAVLDMNEKSSFVCSVCGPRPQDLCMDGVAVGMLFDKVKDINMDEFVIPFESSEILDAPSFRERMFIKNKKKQGISEKMYEKYGISKFQR